MNKDQKHIPTYSERHNKAVRIYQKASFFLLWAGVVNVIAAIFGVFGVGTTTDSEGNIVDYRYSMCFSINKFLNYYLERAVECEPGAQQRRELASDREQLVARDGLRLEPPPARRLRRRGRARRGGRGGRRVRDLHRHQPAVAQVVDDLALVGGVQLAGGDFARRADGAVTIERHASFPASRAGPLRTSSIRPAPCACRPRTS